MSRHLTHSAPREGLRQALRVSHLRVPAPSNSFIIRTSMTPLPQTLYNPHLQDPLGSADSKGLTASRFRPQPLYFPHLRDPLGSAGNTGLITPVESALTEF